MPRHECTAQFPALFSTSCTTVNTADKEQRKNNPRRDKHPESSLLEVPLAIFAALNPQSRGEHAAHYLQGLRLVGFLCPGTGSAVLVLSVTCSGSPTDSVVQIGRNQRSIASSVSPLRSADALTWSLPIFPTAK